MKSFKYIFLFLIIVLSGIMPQFIYNWIASGSLLNLETIIESETSVALEKGYTLPFYSIRSVPYILMQILQKYPLYILVTMGILSIIVVITLIDLYHKARLSFYILLSWILSYLIIYGLYYDTTISLLRYMMPIIPAVLIIVSVSVFRIKDKPKNV